MIGIVLFVIVAGICIEGAILLLKVVWALGSESAKTRQERKELFTPPPDPEVEKQQMLARIENRRYADAHHWEHPMPPSVKAKNGWTREHMPPIQCSCLDCKDIPQFHYFDIRAGHRFFGRPCDFAEKVNKEMIRIKAHLDQETLAMLEEMETWPPEYWVQFEVRVNQLLSKRGYGRTIPEFMVSLAKEELARRQSLTVSQPS